MENQDPTQSLEQTLLLEAVRRERGYDFRNYAPGSLARRIQSTRIKLNQPHVSSLIPLLIHNDNCFNLFLREMSVTVTDMFRDPRFFARLRRDVIPQLRSWPYLKIWCAGCATGEEVYSLAILFLEADLLHRSQFYATDFNVNSLDIARQGSYSLEKMQHFVDNYLNSGGNRDFADYYRARYESVILNSQLRERILFSHHNLVCDGSFGEMNLILCRNVLIYFNQTLQSQVFHLFDQSLCHDGFLCLGDKESMDFSGVEDRFTPLSRSRKIYKKIYPPAH